MAASPSPPRSLTAAAPAASAPSPHTPTPTAGRAAAGASGSSGSSSSSRQASRKMLRTSGLTSLVKVGYQSGTPHTYHSLSVVHLNGFKEDNYAAYVAAAQAVLPGPHASADRLGELAALSKADVKRLSERLQAEGLFRNPSLSVLAERAGETIDAYLRGENAHGRPDCYRAVCVGGNTYANRWWPTLQTAEADLDALEGLLQQRGYKLPPPDLFTATGGRGTTGSLSKAVKWLSDKVPPPPARSLAVFAFCGHGFSVENHLMMVPGEMTHTLDPNHGPLPLAWVEKELRNAGYSDVVFILGCCQSHLDDMVAAPHRAAFLKDNMAPGAPLPPAGTSPMKLCAEQLGDWARQAEADRCPPRTLWIMATGANMPAIDAVLAPTGVASAPAPALSPFMEALLTTWRRIRGLPATQLASRFAETYARSGATGATRIFGTEVLPLDPPSWEEEEEPLVRLSSLNLAATP